MHAVIALTFHARQRDIEIIIRQKYTRSVLQPNRIRLLSIYKGPSYQDYFFHLYASPDHIILFSNDGNTVTFHIESRHTTNELEKLKSSVDSVYDSCINTLCELQIQKNLTKTHVEIFSDSYSLFVGQRKNKYQLSWEDMKKDKLKLLIIPAVTILLSYLYYQFLDSTFNFKNVTITGVATITSIIISLVLDFFLNKDNNKFIYKV